MITVTDGRKCPSCARRRRVNDHIFGQEYQKSTKKAKDSAVLIRNGKWSLKLRLSSAEIPSLPTRLFFFLLVSLTRLANMQIKQSITIYDAIMRKSRVAQKKTA